MQLVSLRVKLSPPVFDPCLLCDVCSVAMQLVPWREKLSPRTLIPPPKAFCTFRHIVHTKLGLFPTSSLLRFPP